MIGRRIPSSFRPGWGLTLFSPTSPSPLPRAPRNDFSLEPTPAPRLCGSSVLLSSPLLSSPLSVTLSVAPGHPVRLSVSPSSRPSAQPASQPASRPPSPACSLSGWLAGWLAGLYLLLTCLFVPPSLLPMDGMDGMVHLPVPAELSGRDMRGEMWRGVAWRDVAWRGVAGGCAWLLNECVE